MDRNQIRRRGTVMDLRTMSQAEPGTDCEERHIISEFIRIIFLPLLGSFLTDGMEGRTGWPGVLVAD